MAANSRRIVEYDILKFLGIIGVVLWHLEVLPNRYVSVVWAVPAFVYATWSLQRNRTMIFRKLLLTYLNIIYIYLVTLGLSLIVFGVESIRPVIESFQFSITGIYNLVIKENAFFTQLWYLALHFQFLLLFLICGKWLKRQNPYKMLLASFILSQLWIFGMDFLFHDYLGIFFVPWLFMGTVGYYFGDTILRFVQSLAWQTKLMIFVAAVGLVILINYNEFAVSYFLQHRDNQFFTVHTYFVFIFVGLFCFAELIQKGAPRLTWLFQMCSLYILDIYISHIFFRQLFKNVFAGTLWYPLAVLFAAILFGITIQKIYWAVAVGVFKLKLRDDVPLGHN